MEGYQGQYSAEQLRDIYYLFRHDNIDYYEMRRDRYPELIKYEKLLYKILNKFYVFKGDYPDYHFSRYTYYDHYTEDIKVRSYNDGLDVTAYVLDILLSIPDEDLSSIDDDILTICEHDFEGNILYKMRSLLIPKSMIEKNLYHYTENFKEHFVNGLFCVWHPKYRDFDVYRQKLLEFYRLIGFHNDCVDSRFFEMIIAYFYAYPEKYNKDYNMITTMLLNYYDRNEEYLKRYSDSYQDQRHFDDRYRDSVSVFKFIESIEPELVKEIKDSYKILTEDKKRDIERITDLVCSGQMSNADGTKYLKDNYGFKSCMFFPQGGSYLEYPNGDSLQYSFFDDNGCQYKERKGR